MHIARVVVLREGWNHQDMRRDPYTVCLEKGQEVHLESSGQKVVAQLDAKPLRRRGRVSTIAIDNSVLLSVTLAKSVAVAGRRGRRVPHAHARTHLVCHNFGARRQCSRHFLDSKITHTNVFDLTLGLEPSWVFEHILNTLT